eukprot:TRINITY_DN1035_c0_g1_i2.p1 TRINITY_DN1035_c0_g1~~TRINITY_DN1035_c0_g1_i2.p1  ORF type:complete len:408 (+),score=143.82 TRINITY_DN1035_c0_g1_i2:80-1303(+)
MKEEEEEIEKKKNSANGDQHNNNNQVERKKYKVIILGSGMGGISAGKEMIDNGMEDFIVLEGRNRIGGRIYQENGFSCIIDLGASWIHGIDGPNPLKKMAEQLGLKMDVTYNSVLDEADFQLFDSNGKEIDPEFEAKIIHKLSLITKAAKDNVEKTEEDSSVEDEYNKVINSTRDSDGNIIQFDKDEEGVLRWHQLIVENWEGGSMGELSAKDHFLSGEDTAFGLGDAFMVDGYSPILNHLLSPSLSERILLNHVVEKIEYEKDEGVTVYTNKGVFQSQFVLCTFPLGILKERTVSFSPPLPAWKQDAIEKIGFGLLDKVVLQYDSPFWNQQNEGFGFVSDKMGEFNFFLNMLIPSKVPILVCYISSQFAKEMELQSNEEIIQRITQIFRFVYWSPNSVQLLIFWSK